MKLKLDENLPHDLAAALRRDGHDVHTVVEEQLAGENDPVVVAAATGEGRLLLTLDRGIGDLRRYSRWGQIRSAQWGQIRLTFPFGRLNRTQTASCLSSND